MIGSIGLLILAAIGWAIFAKTDAPLARFWGGRDKKSPEEHISFLTQYMRTHAITLEQVTHGLTRLPPVAETPDAKRSSGDIAAKAMFFLGAVFVFAGIGVYISMFWDSMSSFMRIFVTLGVGIALSVFSVVVMKEGKYPKAILPLIVMAALVETGGWFVFLHEMFPQGDDWRKAALFCFGVMTLQQALVFHTFRRDSLAFTAIAFGYASLQLVLDIAGMKDEHAALLLGGSMVFSAHVLTRSPHRALSAPFFFFGGLWFNTGIFVVIEQATDMQMASIVAGLTLFSLGYGMRHAEEDKLAGLGFFFGSALFYSGLFDAVHHTPLELLYFAVAVALMYGSALLHSRALLATSVLALLGFIGYYTSEYFMNSASWPIALIIMGIAFLGVGSMAVKIKRKYQL
jgi:Predicted membrane protein (DUF2157)